DGVILLEGRFLADHCGKESAKKLAHVYVTSICLESVWCSKNRQRHSRPAPRVRLRRCDERLAQRKGGQRTCGPEFGRIEHMLLENPPRHLVRRKSSVDGTQEY